MRHGKKLNSFQLFRKTERERNWKRLEPIRIDYLLFSFPVPVSIQDKWKSAFKAFNSLSQETEFSLNHVDCSNAALLGWRSSFVNVGRSLTPHFCLQASLVVWRRFIVDVVHCTTSYFCLLASLIVWRRYFVDIVHCITSYFCLLTSLVVWRRSLLAPLHYLTSFYRLLE